MSTYSGPLLKSLNPVFLSLRPLRIINACQEAGLNEPDILEKDGGFMVVLHKTDVEVSIFAGEEGDATGGQVGGQVEVLSTLTERQKEVFN